MRVVILAAILFVLLIGIPVQSKSDDVSGVVTGYVYDQYRQPLDHAQVLLQSDNTPISIRDVNRNGFFAFLAVLPGKYVVVSRLNGYDDTRTCAFAIHPNQTKSVHFLMRPTVKTLSHVTTTWFVRCPPADPPITF